jgi:hypothetical protein
MKNRRRVNFTHGHMYICDVSVKIRSMTNDISVVLLDESHTNIKACCYRKIWKYLNTNEALRVRLTGLINPVSLRQVISMGGFGIISANYVQSNKFVHLTYHPHNTRNSFDAGWSLGSCDLGLVTSVEN